MKTPISLVIIDDSVSFAENLRKAISGGISSFSEKEIVILPDDDLQNDKAILTFLKRHRTDIKGILINANFKVAQRDRRTTYRGLELYKKIVRVGLAMDFQVMIFSFESLARLRTTDYKFLLDEKHIYWNPFIRLPFFVQLLTKTLGEGK